MPDNKRQHFVPKFYLRNFASTGGAAIGVFNIAAGRLIAQSSLKAQAYRDYYYGKDGVAERHFGDIEGAASIAITTVLKTGRPPKRFGPDHYRLVYFLMLQLGRTTRAEDEANARIDLITKALFRQQHSNPDLLAALDRVTIGQKDAVLGAIKMALMAAPAIYDLRYKLIHNVSDEAFVTSDHPAVRHNQFLESVVDLSTIGLGASGLQIMLPLSPEYTLLFYDDDAYAVGAPQSNVVRLVAPRHAALFNQHQWFEAAENIYFSPKSREVDLRRAAEDMAPFRTRTAEWIDGEVTEETASQKRVRFAFHAPARPIKFDAPFIRLRRPPPDIAGRLQLPMRNPERMVLLEHLGRAFTRGEISLETYRSVSGQVPIRSKSMR